MTYVSFNRHLRSFFKNVDLYEMKLMKIQRSLYVIILVSNGLSELCAQYVSAICA